MQIIKTLEICSVIKHANYNQTGNILVPLNMQIVNKLETYSVNKHANYKQYGDI